MLLLGLACVAQSQPSSDNKKEIVKIGIIAPLTGGEARRGDDIAKLIEILEPHLNQRSSRYHYQFLIEDGKCGAGSAPTTAVMKFINVDKIKFLLTGCSGETLQAGAIAQKSQVLTIAILSLHPDIRKMGDFVFRTYIDVDDSMQRFAKYLENTLQGKIALLTEENAFTFGIRDLLLQYLGAKVALSQDFPLDSADFNTLLTRVKGLGAKAVYFNVMSEGTLANLVNRAVALKLNIKLYSYGMPEAPAFRTATGSNSNGLDFLGTPVIANELPDYTAVRQEYTRRHPEGPSYDYLLRTSYDAIKSIVDGVESVGADATRVKDFLKTYKSSGALGTIQYDETGDILNTHFVVKRMLEDGSIQVIDELAG